MFDGEDSETDELQPDGLWYVYFLALVDPRDPNRDLGLVKVGITKGAVEARIGHLQTGNPFQIHCMGSIQTPVARALECWVHRTQDMAQLEWLRLSRERIPALIAKAQAENERLRRIADARTHWSRIASSGKERAASAEESRLHDEARGVREDFWSATHQLTLTRLRIYVTAGSVGRVPGIIQISSHAPSRKFNARLARERFPELVAGHTVERVTGQFRWRTLATKGSPQWTVIRSEIDDWERKKKQLDQTMLLSNDVFREEGQRTNALIELHESFLALFQRASRLAVDSDYLRARAIQQLEASDAISGVCSYKRGSSPHFNSESFRNAHRAEALESSLTGDPFVHRRVFPSRSY